jgi:hypothetical protein
VLSTGVIDLYHIHYHQPVLLMNTIVERLSDGRGSILGDGRNCLLLLVVQLFPQLKEYRVGSVLDDPETLMMDTALLADLFDYPDEKKTGAQRENAGSRRAPRQQHRRDCALCELPWLTADYHRRARGEAGAMQGAAQVYAAPGSRPVRPGICVCGAVLLMVTFLSF